jgi:hypothetical protein
VSLPSNIEVHVRVRPLLKDEILKSPIKHLKISDSKVISIDNDRDYTFDIVYSEKSTTKEIFENSVKPNLVKSLQGYNFSVFVYGQTVYILFKKTHRQRAKPLQWVLDTLKKKDLCNTRSTSSSLI